MTRAADLSRREQAVTVTLRCRNCGHDVVVKSSSERAACAYCSNVWNWKTKQLIRGQR